MATVRFRQPFYALREARFRQPYWDLRTVRIRQPFEENLTALFRQPFKSEYTARFRQPYSEYVNYTVRFRQPFDAESLAKGSVRFRQPYSDVSIVRFRQPFTSAADNTGSVRFRQLFDALTTTPRTVRFRQPYLDLNPVVNDQSESVTITIGGQSIKLAEQPTVSQDEGSPYWQCSIVPVTASDFGRLTLNKEFSLTFGSTEFKFIVDSRELSRSNSLESNAPERRQSISGLSPLALKAAPRALTVTKTWDVETTAKEIVEELIGSTDWELIDWTIPANRFGVTDQTPLAAAQTVVQAVGGVIESKPNGDILVRSLYPTRVPDYSGASADFQLGAGDISELSETTSAQQYYNLFHIRDSNNDATNNGNQDRLEFVADDDNGLKGLIHAYPSPWRTNFELTQSRPGKVTITELGEAPRQETEEFLDVNEGRFSVRYPVEEVTTIAYHDIDLGGVTANNTEITTATVGNTLITITYQTRSIVYRVEATEPVKTLFLLGEV